MAPGIPQPPPQGAIAAPNTHTAKYYNALTLSYYDIHVLGHNMTHLWRCPTKQYLLPLFQAHFWNSKHSWQSSSAVSGQARTWEQLDIGAGTGYFVAEALQHCVRTDTKAARQPLAITLMDTNEASLKKSKRRIETIVAKHGNNHPVELSTLHGDVLDRIPPEGLRQYDVVTMFNLLHCLRTTPRDKNKAFQFAASSLKDDGILVGCTILPGREYQSGLSGVRARYTLWLYNHVYKVFGNESDTREQFIEGLKANFRLVEVNMVGSMMVFLARKPKRTQKQD